MHMDLPNVASMPNPWLYSWHHDHSPGQPAALRHAWHHDLDALLGVLCEHPPVLQGSVYGCTAAVVGL